MKIKVFGEPEAQTLEQMENVIRAGGVEHAVLCADSHLGYSVPVGGVVAYERTICVNGVGFDIACGNKAVRVEGVAKLDLASIMSEIQRTISFGVGRKNNERVESPIFDEKIWNEIGVLKGLKDKAVAQLGTVGSGNHYVDIFKDELGRFWIGVHFGSRGLGHGIATHYLKAGGGKDGINAAPVLFDERSSLGEEYLRCMELAGRYAYSGRDWVCERVAKILGGKIVEEVHNHHNFAWKEKHFGKDYWVIRKGATPAFKGQKSFVGGSMGDISVILEGTGCEEALHSTIHGAGRVMGRMQAKGKKGRKGLVDPEKHTEWMKKSGVVLRGGDLDESPYAYKRIEKVLKAHEKTINILHTLTPLGVCMADSREFDPYKD